MTCSRWMDCALSMSATRRTCAAVMSTLPETKRRKAAARARREVLYPSPIEAALEWPGPHHSGEQDLKGRGLRRLLKNSVVEAPAFMRGKERSSASGKVRL